MTDWATAWELGEHGVHVDPAGTPRDELDEIELGERVLICYIHEGFANLYSSLEERVWSYMTLMFGYVCQATTWRGLPLPGEWDIQYAAGQLDRMRKEEK